MYLNKFKIIVTSYNNERWLEPNLASILNQTYTNYEVVYIDDHSSDNTFNGAINIVGKFDNWKIISHGVNRTKAYSFCTYLADVGDDEIIVFIDGDDWLYDDNVLERLNNKYQEDMWLTYSKFITYPSATIGYPQGTPYDEYTHATNSYRKDLWRPSHLKTMKGFLWKQISKDDFKYDGEWIKFADDLVMMFAALEMTPTEKIGFMDEISYVYNVSEENQIRTIEDATTTLNRTIELSIRNKKPYDKLK